MPHACEVFTPAVRRIRQIRDRNSSFEYRRASMLRGDAMSSNAFGHPHDQSRMSDRESFIDLSIRFDLAEPSPDVQEQGDPVGE